MLSAALFRHPLTSIISATLPVKNVSSFRFQNQATSVNFSLSANNSVSNGIRDDRNKHSIHLDSLRALEWDKLCDSVASFARTSLGREAVKAQLWSLNRTYEESLRLLDETNAAVEMHKHGGCSLDLSGVDLHLVKSAIEHAQRSLPMDGNEALAIATLLQFADILQFNLNTAIKEDADWSTRFMPLTEVIMGMVVNQSLIKLILNVVDEDGSVKDSASYALRQSRDQVQKLEKKDQTSGRTFGRARMLDGLYYFDEYSGSHKITQSFSSISSFSVKEQIILWHRRLGHPNFFYLKNLFPKLFKGVDCSNFHCESCIFAKNHRSTFLPKPYKSSKPFYLIHSDVWGPSKVVTYSGKRWFVTFIDDHTRLSWVYLMKNKSEVQDIFKDFYNMIETQFQTKISILHSDNGTEYFNEHLSVFLKDKGIVHQSTCRDTPQQNGIAERKNRHILDVARAIMFAMHVPKYLWGDAVLTAIYLINRMPTKILSFKTPLDVLKEIFPNTHSHSDLPIKVFGCTTYVHIPSSFRSKLDHRAVKCIFLGYATNKKGYKCFNPHTQKLYVSMDVSFLENQPFFTENYLQGEKPKLEEDNFWDVSIPLPNVVCLDFPSASMPTIETSNSGGELLQKDPTDSNPEFKFYTRRRLNQMNKDWIADSSLIQSDTLRNDSETTAMADNEAIEIVGAERFSNYTGYAFNFRFAGNHVDKQEIDSLGRRKTFITAIDALCSPGMRQYSSQFLLREVNKAFCGFFDQSKYKQYETLFLESEDVTDRNDTSRNNLPVHESTSNTREHCFGKSLTPECLDDKDDIGIATGNWGCGAFGGDPQVKSIIQWLAASQALRPFVSYYTFGIEALQNIEKVSEWILGHKWTVGDLWSMLVEYSSQISKGQTHVGFFDWLLPASSKTNFCCFS